MLELLEEPQLEFGNQGRHVDTREGLKSFGPFDLSSSSRPSSIRIGVVASRQDRSTLEEWLDKCHKGIPAREGVNQPNLFPRFQV